MSGERGMRIFVEICETVGSYPYIIRKEIDLESFRAAKFNLADQVINDAIKEFGQAKNHMLERKTANRQETPDGP